MYYNISKEVGGDADAMVTADNNIMIPFVYN